jgi:hypothetical protein
VVFLDLQKARFLPWLPRWLRSWELGYLAYSLGEPLPAELAHVRFWRDRRAHTHWDSRTRRCVQESSGFTAFRFEGAKGFRRRDADEAALLGALGALGSATLIKDAANGRLLRSGAWILKEHASARAARRAWLGGSGLEARGFATGRALAWVGRWLVMRTRRAPTCGCAVTSRRRCHRTPSWRHARPLSPRCTGGVYADLRRISWSPGASPVRPRARSLRPRVSRRRRVKNLAQLNAALPDEVPDGFMRPRSRATWRAATRHAGGCAGRRR